MVEAALEQTSAAAPGSGSAAPFVHQRILWKPAPDQPMRLLEPGADRPDPSPDQWLWIDVADPDEAHTLELGEHFGFDQMALEDALEDTSIPQLTDYGDYLFLILRGIGHEGVETHEVNAFVAMDYLITLHPGGMPAVDELFESSQRVADVSKGGPDRMLAHIAGALGRPFRPLVDDYDQRIDELADQAIQGDRSVIRSVQRLRRNTIRMRRIVVAQRDILFELGKREAPPVREENRIRFLDAYEQHDRLASALESGRLLLGTVLETYRSAVAERMNEVMKVLTVFSAIVLPLSLIAGIYGMNFMFMPELDWRLGYPLALLAMAIVGLSLWVYFVRRGFVGGPRLRRVPRRLRRLLIPLLHQRPARHAATSAQEPDETAG